MKKALLSLAVLLALVSCARLDPGTGLPGVSLQELRHHVEYLASDRLGGREVGSPGIALAEQYIARWFAACGLEPLPGKRSYFQEFTLYRRGFTASSLALTVHGPAGELVGTPGADFRPFEFSAEGTLEAPVVFAGYGITAPERGWDDYQGLDVKGSFVLVLRHEPRKWSTLGDAPGPHALFTAKAENAGRHGAAGMLLVDDPLSQGPAEDQDLTLRGAYSLAPPAGPKEEPSGILAVHVGRAVADLLIRPTGLTLQGIQQSLDAGKRSGEFPLGRPRVRLRIQAAETTTVEARNVVGFLRGSDPRLEGRWLLIGAHHDHLGSIAGKGDTVYNGADDNASGVAGMLTLARLFSRWGSWHEEQAPSERSPPALARRFAREAASLLGLAARPRRSLVFAAFSAEEEGLLGSRFLARELAGAGPGLPGFVLNLDMIGRNSGEPLQVLGSGSAPGLREVVERADRPDAGSGTAGAAPAVRFPAGVHEGGSDQASFSMRGVPFLFFFSGLHADYHRLGDEADRLSYPHLAEVLGLAWRVVSLLAENASSRAGAPAGP